MTDGLNQSVFGLGLGCHRISWSFHLKDSYGSRKTPDFSWEEDAVNTFIKEGTSYKKLIFRSRKFHQIRLLLYRQGCHHTQESCKSTNLNI